ncbi:four-helix bundle copper-binding protein [Calothrix sp. 336/3]|uniref:four-helix bundle copper-binding protein n=1 Tax=Calothrix sp. 336/3 TaxID=1337936 RepID=UPI000555EB22|nr:four-helix bundle copper-binding protein [Calothrix sp. 336/3]AKG20634.1 ferredoxin [Calothrix sp. 336/3]
MMLTEPMLVQMEICQEVCIECQKTCIDTLSYCKSQNNIEMTLICMMRDCAEMCMMCVNTIADGSEFAGRTCELCAEMCDRAALACELHTDEKIRMIATICRQCARKCRIIGQQSAAYFRRPNFLTVAEVIF